MLLPLFDIPIPLRGDYTEGRKFIRVNFVQVNGDAFLEGELKIKCATKKFTEKAGERRI